MASPQVAIAQLEPVEGTNPAAIYAETLTHAEAERQIFDLAYNEYVEKAHLLIEALRREADNSAELHKKELQTSAAGNGMAFAGAAAIAGSLMALGPLAPLGIGLSVFGVGTLTAATVIEKVLENRIEEKLAPMLREYEAACRTFRSVQENASAFATEYKRLSQQQPSSTAETLVARTLAPSVAAMNGARLATAAAQTTAHTGKILGSSVLSRVSLHVVGKGGSHSAAVAAVGVGTMVASGAFVAVNGALVVKSLVDVARNHPGEFSKKLSDMADAICHDLGILPQVPGCQSGDELSAEVCHVVGKSLPATKPRPARQRPLSPRTARVCRARMSECEVEHDAVVVVGHVVVDEVSAAVTEAMRHYAGAGAGGVERTAGRIKRQSGDEVLVDAGGDVVAFAESGVVAGGARAEGGGAVGVVGGEGDVVCAEGGGAVGVGVVGGEGDVVCAEGGEVVDDGVDGGCAESGVAAGGGEESNLLFDLRAGSEVLDVRQDCELLVDAAAGGGGGGGGDVLVDVSCAESDMPPGGGAESDMPHGGSAESNLLVVASAVGEVLVDVGRDGEDDGVDELHAEP